MYEVIYIEDTHTEAGKTELYLKCIGCSLAINLGASNRIHLIIPVDNSDALNLKHHLSNEIV